MASTKHTLTPNGDDTDGSDDWTVVTNILGDSIHNVMATTNSTRYVKSNSIGVRNKVTFTNLDGTSRTTTPPIHWIQYNFNYGSNLASEVFQVQVQLQDGEDSDTALTDDTLQLTAPSNTDKVNTFTSPILPFHSGTDRWTEDNLDNIKFYFRLIDNDVGSSATTEIEMHYVSILVMRNDNDRTEPATYVAKKGMTASRGVLNIGG